MSEALRAGLRLLEREEAEFADIRNGLLEGLAHSRSCAVLVDDAEDLKFARTGEHFLVFLDQPEEVVIVDILQARSDLPRRVATLMALRRGESI